MPNPYALELNQRVWDDAPYGQMSSDGQQVFLLWKLASDLEQMSTRVLPFGRQMPDGSVETNKLVALDLQAEGKLRWIVGDEDGTDEPKLAGAFFLGPPLPLLGQLYVLAEINGEIRLVVLDAATGRLQWAQQLAQVDQREIMQDPTRRAAGASPSFSDGILVCPTSAGAVVAVDISTRSLLWGYQYAPMTAASPQRPERVPDADPTGRRAVDRRHGDDRRRASPGDPRGIGPTALPGPADRQTDLGTAAARRPAVHGRAWPAARRSWWARIACRRSRWQDGSVVWTKGIAAAVCRAAAGCTPAGRISCRPRPATCSNSTCTAARSSPISKPTCRWAIWWPTRTRSFRSNVDWLSAYYQTEPLREVVDRRLQESPDDVWGLARRAELLLYDGQHAAAVEALRHAYRLAPQDDAIRTALVPSADGRLARRLREQSAVGHGVGVAHRSAAPAGGVLSA